MSKYVFYDCDVGTGDAWSLLMLTKVEEVYKNYKQTSPNEFKILGVTCVNGNTDVDNAAANTLRVLDSRNKAHYFQIPLPYIEDIPFQAMNNYVIYDCDVGTDDAWGLLMLTKAEEVYKKYKQTSPNAFKILGVTCVHGNTDVDNAAVNTLRVLDSIDRLDIPVYKGCAKPMISHIWNRRKHFHGKDGFGDIQHERKIDVECIQKQHAVNVMYELACKYPKQVDFILVGPLTNFATCITMYGDDFLDKVRDIYIMGGNVRGKGNATKSAEFNFMIDPEAANIVLENVKTPLTILPWETCIEGDRGITFAWRMEVCGKVPSKAIELLNRVEDAIFIPKGLVTWAICDAMLVATYILPQHAIAKTLKYHATVELSGLHTRGQMVLDHLRNKEDNARIIMEIHKNHCKDIISWTAGVDGVCLNEQF